MTNETKRKRGRPKKPKPELPKFKNDRDIREYLLGVGLELSLELKEHAVKTNNIKNPKVTSAKTQQYKTALSSLKIVNDILKDKQLDNLEEKLQLMEEGIISSSVNHDVLIVEDLPEETVEKLEKLQQLQTELEKISTE